MAKQVTTGLIRRVDELEWTTIRAVRPGAGVVTGHERVPVEFAAEPPATAEDGVPGPLVPAAMKETAARLRGWIAAGLPTDKVLIRILDLPTDSEDELAGMIQLQMEKLSPFPVESMVISHEVMARREGATRVLVAATRQEVAGACYQSFAEAGIEPACLDAALLGRLRVLKDEQLIPAEGRWLIALLEEGDPELIVFEGGSPVLFHTIEGSGATPEELQAHMAGEIGYALMTAEVEYGAAQLQGGLVIGFGDSAGSLAEAFTTEYGVRWETRSVESLPPASEGLARRMADRLFNIGCIDLTPPAHRLMDRLRVSRRRMAAAALFVAGFWVAAVGGFAGYYFFQQQRLASLEGMRDQLKAPAVEVRAIQSRVALVQKYMSVSNSVLECLRAICVGQPQGVDLTSFSFKKAESTRFTGDAEDSGLVYNFKTALDASGVFTDTSLKGPNVELRKGKQVYTFEMELKLPGGAL